MIWNILLTQLFSVDNYFINGFSSSRSLWTIGWRDHVFGNCLTITRDSFVTGSYLWMNNESWMLPSTMCYEFRIHLSSSGTRSTCHRKSWKLRSCTNRRFTPHPPIATGRFWHLFSLSGFTRRFQDTPPKCCNDSTICPDNTQKMKVNSFLDF